VAVPKLRDATRDTANGGWNSERKYKTRAPKEKKHPNFKILQLSWKMNFGKVFPLVLYEENCLVENFG
jgi:hypothetical protein